MTGMVGACRVEGLRWIRREEEGQNGAADGSSRERTIRVEHTISTG